MDILTLIDRMEEVIDHGRNVPMTQQRMVDTDKLYELIDEIRAQYPGRAQAGALDRQGAPGDARGGREGGQPHPRGGARARPGPGLRAGGRPPAPSSRPPTILDDARSREREIRLGAEDYADEMLANLEVNLGKLLTAVQRGRDRLQGRVNPRQ